jgi:hypothetical protein
MISGRYSEEEPSLDVHQKHANYIVPSCGAQSDYPSFVLVKLFAPNIDKLARTSQAQQKELLQCQTKERMLLIGLSKMCQDFNRRLSWLTLLPGIQNEPSLTNYYRKTCILESTKIRQIKMPNSCQ